MFSLDELKMIRKNYIYWNDTKELKLQFRAKGDPSIKKPEELTQDEKNKIISGLYEYAIIRNSWSKE